MIKKDMTSIVLNTRFLLCSFISFFVVMFIFLAWRETDISVAPLSMTVLIMVIAMILLWDVARARFSLLSPKTMVITGFLAFFTFGAIVNAERYQQYPSPLIFLCAGLISIGIIFFTLGFGLGERYNASPSFLQSVEVLDQSRLFKAFLALMSIGFIFILYVAFRAEAPFAHQLLSGRGQIGGIEFVLWDSNLRYFVWLRDFIAIGAILASFLLAKRWGGYVEKILLWSGILFALTIKFFVGSRYSLIWLLISIFLSYWVGLRPRKETKNVNYLFIAIVIAAIPVSLISQYRHTGYKGLNWRQINYLNFNPLIEGGLDQFFSPLEVIEAIPRDYDYLYGSSYYALLVNFIPRKWWEDKPGGFSIYMDAIRGDGGLYTTFQGNILGSSVSASIIGELYGNFGYLGIPLGMLVFGGLAGWWYKLFRSCSDNVGLQLLFIHSLPVFVMEVRGDFLAVTTAYLMQAIPLYVAIRSSCISFKPRHINS